MRYTTCRSCHRIIGSDYRFCPYCGTERVHNYRFRQLLDQPFDEMDTSEKDYSIEWLARLEQRLLVLETDLDAFLSPITARRR